MDVALVASLVAPILRAEANGPHSVILDLAHGLIGRGHQVRLYAAAGSVVDGVDVCGVPVEPAAQRAAVRTDGRTDPVAEAALRSAFSTLYGQLRHDGADVVSQHAFDAPAIELAKGLPVVHTLHLPPIGEAVIEAARATSAPLATVSEAGRRSWRRVGVRVSVVLRNGVPKRAIPRAVVEPIALIAGRVAPEKGTDVAIRLARRAGLAPVVVGDVYDVDYYTDHVAPLLGAGEFRGPIGRAQLSDLMARSAVLLMPVRWDEAFGLVAAEAQMAGCPVAAYRRGALPEVVREALSGYLAKPDDEEDLLSACRRALDLDRAVIRSWAERQFGLEAMVEGYERVLAATGRTSRPRATNESRVA